MITEEQVQIIDAQIQKSTIKDKKLRDDLLDHLCCLVEDDLLQGVDFQQACQLAFAQLAPHGLDEIQQETIFLVHQHRIMTLRRFIFLSGYLFLLISLTGLYFKKMYWPIADELLIVGIGGLLLIHFPLTVFSRRKYLSGKIISLPLRWLVGCLLISATIIFFTVNVIGLGGYGIVTSLCFFIIGVVLLPLKFREMYKRAIRTT
ncbi:MAG: hypothetical protein AAF944_29410 [Bacteroidota bacterium]